MRKINSIHLFAVLFLFMITAASAQRKNFEVKFNWVIIRNVNTPVFTDKIDTKAPVNPKQWGVIMVEYEVKFNNAAVPLNALDNGKWLDDVEIKWEFLHKKGDVNDLRKLGRFSRTVKYTGVGEGKQRVCLFVNPTNMKRYFGGGSELNEPHHYVVQGKTFVIEYNNTQNSANHVHAIWRNLAGDFNLPAK